MQKTLRLVAIAGAFAALPLTAALADRDPSPEERQIIADVLRSQGFTGWGDVEWDDDGYWEVDEAQAPDGSTEDLQLDQAFMIINSDRN